MKYRLSLAKVIRFSARKAHRIIFRFEFDNSVDAVSCRDLLKKAKSDVEIELVEYSELKIL
jgi:hypothetical protein